MMMMRRMRRRRMIREKEKERPLQYFSFQRRYRPSTVGITTEERKGFWSQNKSDQMWTASSAGMWTSKASQWCTMWTMWSSEHDGVHSVKKSDPLLPSSARVTKTTRARRDNNLSSFAHLSSLFHLENNCVVHLAYQDCVSFVHILHRAWKYVWFFVHCVHCSRHEIISKPSKGTLQQC